MQIFSFFLNGQCKMGWELGLRSTVAGLNIQLHFLLVVRASCFHSLLSVCKVGTTASEAVLLLNELLVVLWVEWSLTYNTQLSRTGYYYYGYYVL